MAKLIPFKAKRPTRDKAYLVASRSYMSYTLQDLEDKLAGNPYTFLHIINPKEYRDQEANKEKYIAVKNEFERFWNEGIFKQDAHESYYLYRQSYDQKVFYGLVGGLSVTDYQNDIIKKHEHTLSAREELFKEYLLQTGFHAEPVLVAHSHDEELDKLYQKYFKTRAEYEFTSTDRILHELWVIDESADVTFVKKRFEKQKALYIADGHHRSASASRLYDYFVEQNAKVAGAEFFMSFLIDENLLHIDSFYRQIREVSKEQRKLLEQVLQADCNAKVLSWDASYALSKNEFIYYNSEKKWLCSFPEAWQSEDSISQNLEVQLLNDHILNAILGISNPKTDPRLSYSPGVVAEQEIQNWVRKNESHIAFNVAPVDFDTVREIADQGESMPPKSTYIEPKLRSGLLVYDFMQEKESEVAKNLLQVKKMIPKEVTLVAVSKFKSNQDIMHAYQAGHLHFGENRVQEFLEKQQSLPQDIHWHLIGHLQTNKVKQIIGKTHLIHSVDSLKLLEEINKQSAKNKVVTSILLQVHIAQEETKFGLSEQELDDILEEINSGVYPNIKLNGLMGMATFTEKTDLIRSEFVYLNGLFKNAKSKYKKLPLNILSMGMSGDYNIAIEEGSNMIRLGSSIFGSR